LKKLPKKVTLLPEPENYQYIDLSIRESLTNLIKKKDFKLAASRSMLGYLAKTEKSGAIIEQKFWRYLSKSLNDLQKIYDVAIGFQEKNPIYFCVDKVKAKRKIGWVHTDYNKLGTDLQKDNDYFNKLDYIVTVSEGLVGILKELFHDNENKIKCIHNVVSTRMIKKMSIEEIDFKKDSESSISLISVGRLAKEKGLDISLEACEILINKGYDIKWYLIGEGNMREVLEKAIDEKNLTNRVSFLGQRENPYPYIKESDIYIQTSRYEGKSISIDEAKVLAKPIVIANFDTAKNHIIDGVNGIISKMDAISVADSIELLIKQKELRTRLIENLNKEDFGTESEINKLYKLFEFQEELTKVF
jgi:glycosyltransferase involved in cell wall biosynthesis